jgi:hypothetical protein
VVALALATLENEKMNLRVGSPGGATTKFARLPKDAGVLAAKN